MSNSGAGVSSAQQALVAAGGKASVYVPLASGSPMAASGSSTGAAGGATSGLPSSAPLSKYKVVFLGDSGAGKTSLIKTFIYGPGQFESSYSATIGIDFLAKTIFLADRTVRLQIWDSAGQERFRSLIPSYIRDSSVAIVVYDITSRPSFVNAGRWIEDVRAERGTDVLIVLVGNKTDMPERRVVAYDEGERRAREEGITFIECSAKLGHNVQQLFRGLATALPSAAPGGGGAAAGAGADAASNSIDIKLSAAASASVRGGGAAGGSGAAAGGLSACGCGR